MLPVTIKQIIDSKAQEEESFRIDGREATQITFVAQIIDRNDGVSDRFSHLLPCESAFISCCVTVCFRMLPTITFAPFPW